MATKTQHNRKWKDLHFWPLHTRWTAHCFVKAPQNKGHDVFFMPCHSNWHHFYISFLCVSSLCLATCQQDPKIQIVCTPPWKFEAFLNILLALNIAVFRRSGHVFLFWTFITWKISFWHHTKPYAPAPLRPALLYNHWDKLPIIFATSIVIPNGHAPELASKSTMITMIARWIWELSFQRSFAAVAFCSRRIASSKFTASAVDKPSSSVVVSPSQFSPLVSMWSCRWFQSTKFTFLYEHLRPLSGSENLICAVTNPPNSIKLYGMQSSKSGSASVASSAWIDTHVSKASTLSNAFILNHPSCKISHAASETCSVIIVVSQLVLST